MGFLLKDMGKVLTASYAHNIDAATVAGAEVSRRLDEKEVTTFTLGCVRMSMPAAARRLQRSTDSLATPACDDCGFACTVLSERQGVQQQA